MLKARQFVFAACFFATFFGPAYAFAWGNGIPDYHSGDGCGCGGANSLLLTISFAVSCLAGFCLPLIFLTTVALRILGVFVVGPAIFGKWYWDHALEERYLDACTEVRDAVKAGQPLYAVVITADYLGRFVLGLGSKLKDKLVETVTSAAGYGNPRLPGGR